MDNKLYKEAKLKQRLKDNLQHLIESLKRKKTIEQSIEQNVLPKLLNWYDLCAYGIAATVGSGIFVVSGAVATKTGPSIIISILLAGLASLITGFCYLEFASRIPTSGSAYVYAYTSLGELIGWFIGWSLTLEYSISAAAIASSWGSYIVALFDAFNVVVPKVLYQVETRWDFCKINVLALLIVLFVTAIILAGLKSSAWFTNIITVLNISAIILVIVAGCFYVNKENWSVFFPGGASGVMGGAAQIFFSYIGFDTVCTLTSEARRARRDIPIAVISTVVLATVLYMCVGLVLTGMVNYKNIDIDAPLAKAFLMNGNYWATKVISICSVTTMTATMLACLLGQPRIFYSMAQDGLMPLIFTRLVNNTPMAGVILSCFIAGVLGLLFNIDALSQMVSLGTLLAFSVVCGGLMTLRVRNCYTMRRFGPLTILYLGIGSLVTWLVLRFTTALYIVIPIAVIGILIPNIILLYIFIKYSADLRQTTAGFVCPLVPILPSVAIMFNTYLMMQLNGVAYISFVVWAVIGIIIYFIYGMRHSVLNTLHQKTPLVSYDGKSYEKETLEDSTKEMQLENICHTPEKSPSLSQLYVPVDDASMETCESNLHFTPKPTLINPFDIPNSTEHEMVTEETQESKTHS
jgi:APA family basic amino acid/polyamine antiporter